MAVSLRSAIGSLYTGRLTISNYKSVDDPITHQTTQELVPVKEDIPCRLSTVRMASQDEAGGAPVITQQVKVFISPDEIIPSGSVLTITQNGVTKRYQKSGEPFVYSNHQEIMLTLYEEFSK